MSKTTNTILAVAAAAAAAYVLFAKPAAKTSDVLVGDAFRNVSAETQIGANAQAAVAKGDITQEEADQLVEDIKQVTRARAYKSEVKDTRVKANKSSSSSKSSYEAGVRAINTAVKKNVQLPRTSTLHNRNVRVIDKRTGESKTGDIVRLASGKTALIQVRKVS